MIEKEEKEWQLRWKDDGGKEGGSDYSRGMIGRGGEEIYVKREIKEDTWWASADTELDTGRQEELSEDAIVEGEIWENAALQTMWWNVTVEESVRGRLNE